MVWSENFRNFLSFTFYVKSILKNLEVLKIADFAIFGALNYVQLVNFSLEIVQKYIKHPKSEYVLK